MNAVLVWFVLGAVLMVGELFTPAFIVVFFGIGAWAAALVAALWPGLEQELVAFLAVALSSLFLLRRRLVQTFQGRRTEARQNAPTFPHGGRQAKVIRAIPAGGEGEISMGGSFWRATADAAIPTGVSVRVLEPSADDELLLKVAPLGEPAPGKHDAVDPAGTGLS